MWYSHTAATVASRPAEKQSDQHLTYSLRRPHRQLQITCSCRSKRNSIALEAGQSSAQAVDQGQARWQWEERIRLACGWPGKTAWFVSLPHSLGSLHFLVLHFVFSQPGPFPW